MPHRTKARENIVPLLRREVGPAEITRAVQIRQFVNERMKIEEPIAALIILATADGRVVTNKIGIDPSLLAVMRDEAKYAARRMDDDLAESQGGTVHHFRPHAI